MSGPYALYALRYWDAGWQGVLPLPLGDKYPPPRGFTGAGALMPSYADVHAWTEGSEGDGNLGLRLPPGVIGLDVDAYGDKVGGVTFAERHARWGPLPGTWRLSSRQDGVSGIYLYTIPAGLRWPGVAGPGVEIIEHRYRYAVAWPSVHPNGGIYRWHYPHEDAFSDIPSPAWFPALPESWVQGLTHGQSVTDISKVEVSDSALWVWLQSRPGGAPCSEMFHSVVRINERLLSTSHSRHETMMTGVMHLTHLSAEGHPGIEAGLGMVRARFLDVATLGHDPRTPEAAAAEWHRALTGAAGVALADVDAVPWSLDPCVSPLAADVPLGGSTLPAAGLNGVTRHDEAGTMILNAQGGDQLDADRCTEPDALIPEPVTPSPPALDSSLVEGTPSGQVERAGPPDVGYMLLQLEEEIRRQDVREMARDIRETRKAAKRWREPPGSNLLSAPEPDPIRWAIEDVLPADSNVVLTAQYKSGKTTLVLNLARSLADGQKFLDLYPVVPFDGTIALWNYEVGGSMFTRWAKSQGIENEDRVEMLNLRGYSVALRDSHVRGWAIEYLQSRKAAVWVVDPFARAMQGDENSNEDVARFLDIFDEIKAEAGVKIGMIVTHTGRSETASDRSRGASRIDDWPDVRWVLTSDDDRCRYFGATGRDVETVPAKMIFDPLSRRLSLTGETKPMKARQGKRNLADEILAAVKTLPGMSMRTLIDVVQARYGAVTETVRLLEQQDRVAVVRPGEGKAISIYLPEALKALRGSQ
jgi:AAA domain/Bifunctional DNA primase/polymerase, N-terminal